MSGRADRVAAVVIGLLLLALAALLGRVAQLQTSPGDRLLAHMSERTSIRPEIAARGDILDRRGRVLAASRLGERLFVDPAKLAKPYEETMLRICSAAGLDPAEVGPRMFERLALSERREAEGKGPLRYARVTGLLADWQAEAIRSLDIDGVHLEPVPVREGPAALSASAALVGRTGPDGDGQLGIERRFEEDLTGVGGALRYVRDALGRPMWIERGGYTPPSTGREVRLSLDLFVQDVVEQELLRAVEEADAAGGRAMVVDPHTGEVLAMADVIRELGDRAVAWGKRPVEGGVRRRTIIPPDPARSTHPAAGRARCVTDLFEPGSSFKAFTWSLMTALGKASAEEEFRTGGKQWSTPYRRVIRDTAPRDTQTWREALVNSSNIAHSMVAERLTHGQMREGILRFGFGAETGLGMTGEREGYVPTARQWSKYTQTSVSFGQEVSVTTAQLARAFCVFARAGEMAGTIPALRLRAPDPSRVDDIVVRVLPWRTAAQARLALAEVAKKADEKMRRLGVEATFRYEMFGKSGTAQVSLAGERGYLEDQYISNFVGAAPAHRPALVCVVVIDDPGPELVGSRRYFGSDVAAPPVRRILERSLAYMGVAPAGAAQASASEAE